MKTQASEQASKSEKKGEKREHMDRKAIKKKGGVPRTAKKSKTKVATNKQSTGGKA